MPTESNASDRIARALAEEEAMMNIPAPEATEPSLRDMLDETIAATEDSLEQLHAARQFLEDVDEADLPRLVRGALQHMIVPMYHNSYQYNRK